MLGCSLPSARSRHRSLPITRARRALEPTASAEGGAVEPFAKKEAETRFRQPVDGLGAVYRLGAQSQPCGGQAGPVAVDPVYDAQVEQRAILDVAGQQGVKGGCVDIFPSL